MHFRCSVAILAALFMAGACGTSPTPSRPVAEAPATSAPSPTAPLSPSAVEASSTPAPTPTPLPRPTKRPTFTERERETLENLRSDARIDCTPRRSNLPTNADSGVECRVHSALVDRVGIYSFADPRFARAAYLTTLTESGVELQHGDCAAGEPGDAAWSVDQVAGDDEDDLPPMRAGCFFNELGIANVRVTCGGGIYIGILGQDDDLVSLWEWAWRVANGTSTNRDAPGICAFDPGS